MRKAFIDAIINSARQDDTVFLLTGDLGFSVFEQFRAEFPERFFNVGVAEQNMIGLASGLALMGKKVVVYSIATFATMRCFEQIRNDICLHKASVTIVGMGAGLHYGSAGPTHHGTEDMGIMRTLPHMTIISPASPMETTHALQAAVALSGPSYIRLSNTMGANIDELYDVPFMIGQARALMLGGDITLIATGGIVGIVVDVARALARAGIRVSVLSMHTIKPLDSERIIQASRSSRLIVSIEEHSEIGGLGSAIAEILAESKFGGVFKRLALPSLFVQDVGNREELCDMYGLSAQKIEGAIRDATMYL
jgi:transketolase